MTIIKSSWVPRLFCFFAAFLAAFAALLAARRSALALSFSSPSLWASKKCAYLWRRAPPRARPRDVGSWQQEANEPRFPHGVFQLHAPPSFFSVRHPSCVAGTLTPHACHRHFQGSNSKPKRKRIVLGAAPLSLLLFFLLGLRARRSALSLSLSNPSRWACSTHA